MDAFNIEIAGVVFEIMPLFQSTKEYFRQYLTDRTAEYPVRLTHDDLVYEQYLLDCEAVEEGLKKRKFSEPFLERSVFQRRIADLLVPHNVLMLHGSTVAVDGAAYLFSAPCGTGKSTHTRSWMTLFGDRAVMVNDDKPFLRITSSGVMAYGSPWNGKHGASSNVCVPLKGICLLHRGNENTIHRVATSVLRDHLLHQLHLPDDPILRHKVLDLADALFREVPLWEMYCNKELDAANVSYSAMSAAGDRSRQTVIP